MKRYKSIQQKQNLFEDYLIEGVLHPDIYLLYLIDKLLQIKNKVMNEIHSGKYLCNFLSKYFEKDKIKFTLNYSEIKSKDNIIKATYNIDTEEINLICNFKTIEDIQYNEDSFDEFKYLFEELVGHELIHRLQAIHNKEKISHVYDVSTKEGLIKYLSDVHEIMTHAWQSSQAIKMLGFDRDSLSKFLSIDKLVNKIYTLRLYKSNFNVNSPVLKRFYKYLYMYFD